jgi:hypothetical protein
MLLPDKHITLAESILGLGSFVLGELLERPQSVDRLYKTVSEASESPTLPAYHDFDALLLAILFLYSIGIVEATENGGLKLCAS